MRKTAGRTRLGVASFFRVYNNGSNNNQGKKEPPAKYEPQANGRMMILTSSRSISTDAALCRLMTKSVGWGSTMVLWLISVAFLLHQRPGKCGWAILFNLPTSTFCCSRSHNILTIGNSLSTGTYAPATAISSLSHHTTMQFGTIDT